jgi:hypothetical protein
MSINLGALTLLDTSGPAWPLMGVLYLLVTREMTDQPHAVEALLSLDDLMLIESVIISKTAELLPR